MKMKITKSQLTKLIKEEYDSAMEITKKVPYPEEGSTGEQLVMLHTYLERVSTHLKSIKAEGMPEGVVGALAEAQKSILTLAQEVDRAKQG